MAETIYTSEIEAMLHAFGDVWKPLPQTVSLVESILRSELCKLVQRASEIAEMRGSTAVGMEEFVFLLRNNKRKLIHFVQHVKFKDLKTSLSRNLDSEEVESAASSVQDDGQTKPSRRYKVCWEFLQSIDNKGGYIASSLTDIDVIKLARQERADKQTRHMSSEEYVRFAQCRQVTFLNRMNKFCEWFDHLLPLLSRQPNTSGWEALCFLARETVGEIVDLCLVIQREQENNQYISGHMNAVVTAESCTTDIRGSADVVTERGKFREELAIKPSLVREALRRNSCFFK